MVGVSVSGVMVGVEWAANVSTWPALALEPHEPGQQGRGLEYTYKHSRTPTTPTHTATRIDIIRGFARSEQEAENGAAYNALFVAKPTRCAYLPTEDLPASSGASEIRYYGSGQCATRCGAKEVPHATSVGVAWQPAVTSMSRGHRHFLYLAQTFDGNSGGAVVVGRTGEVIGLHQQLVNQAAEVVRHKLTWASAWTPWKNH
jgi:hypothetical protein